ncbi:adenylate/guanylate cyclase domain-containing protein [Nocardioides sp. Bht2]|uniref:adenylate/guanylate cyclase domain-containing protein n=1 Tax=Nocardioides sp. Bht2 TaxID=3392297 RepID=UPI0039B4E52B
MTRFRSWRARLALSLGLVVINLVGTVLVYCLLAFAVPLPQLADDDRVRLLNLIGAAIVVTVAVGVGVWHLNAVLTPLVHWVRRGAPHDDPGRLVVLRAPAIVARRQGATWLCAALLFGALNAPENLRLGAYIALTVALVGWSTTAFSYLAAERALRSFAQRALEGDAPMPNRRTVVGRELLTWWLSTGIVLLGLVLVGIFTLTGSEATITGLAVTMVVLSGIGLSVGVLATYLAAKASADPLRGLRRAVAEIERGNYEVAVPIYDATEIGHLQAGFNKMAAGLRERERIRELFGRHVGTDVARQALADDVTLGGEAREVTVLFVDIIGSTTIAEEREPEQVVALLNQFFAVVVEVVDAHGGWINKFAGDAALAIWGAPAEVPDRATLALRAARVMGERLRAEVPELRAGIGVSTGRAVAGNIGADQRSEYTVIGDPVNEAARLTDLAKQVPAAVLVRADLLAAADPVESVNWKELDPIQVRGRQALTPVATPLDVS